MRCRLFIWLSGLAVVLTACSNPVRAPHQLGQHPVSLRQATEFVAAGLFEGIRQDKGMLDWLRGESVAIDPVIDSYSQEQVAVSKEITEYIKAVGKVHKIEHFAELSQESLRSSQYLIQGTIGLEMHPGEHAKFYHLQAVALNVRSGEMIASADAWIADKQLNYEQLPEFRDSPIYVVNQQAHSQLKDSYSSRRFLMGIQASALLNDAGNAYRSKRYDAALRLFREAELHAIDDDILRVYAGLYMSYLRLGQVKEAEKAFEKLLRLSFDQMNVLTLRILFQVDSEKFYGDVTTQAQYQFWLKKIAEYLGANQRCLKVVGHSSRTGSVEYNDALSLSRANQIKSVLETGMKPSAASIETEGLGFRGNLVGSGTDDERDMLDRRVEFKLPACRR